MARNMIDANQKVFDKIINYVNSKDPKAGIGRAKRYIRSNDEEKEWIRKIVINCERKLSFSTHSALFSFNDDIYFVFFGWTDLSCDKDEIDEIEINTGIFTAIVAESAVEIRKGISAEELIENVLSQHEDEKYSGHALDDVVSCFQPFSVYRIKKASPLFNDGIDRVSAYFLATNAAHLPLPFSPHTLASFERICLEGTGNFDYGTTLTCLSSVSWDYAFLSMYRPLERLFSLPKVLDLKEKVAPALSLLEFSAEIERCTGWRPKEDEALESLLSRGGIDAVVGPIKEVSVSISGDGAANIAKFIYKVRNSIVHYRPATPALAFDDCLWDKLLRGLCDIVNEIYSFYGSHLSGIPIPKTPVAKAEFGSEEDARRGTSPEPSTDMIA